MAQCVKVIIRLIENSYWVDWLTDAQSFDYSVRNAFNHAL